MARRKTRSLPSAKWAPKWNASRGVIPGQRIVTVAVARRSHFEAGEFEVVYSPEMKIIASGFTSRDDAEARAIQINAEMERKAVK